MNIPKSLSSQINKFVEEYLDNSKEIHVRGEKVIHESLWGTQRFHPYEIAILDTRLLQRLRQIRQAGFVYLTYPTTTHSRFEHTLGVVAQSTKLANALREKEPTLIKDSDLINIRLAALLHDCGHGPFSHTSEERYRYLPEMQKLTGEGGAFEGKTEHEILAYLIINSEAFISYFNRLQKNYNFKADVKFISNAIIGEHGTQKEIYKEEIVNGPFDADKLDYIYRDSHFSGIKLSVDLDRLWYTAEIRSPKKAQNRLVIAHNGALTLEQILFCKMSLYSTIYHHPKVRACDCMFKGIIEYCLKHDKPLAGRDVSKIASYLHLTDEMILGESHRKNNDRHLKRLIDNMAYRRLFKRALVISHHTICGLGDDDGDDNPLILKLTRLRSKTKENFETLRELARDIWKAAGKPCLPEEVWIDMPSLPSNKEIDDTYIKQIDDTFIPLNRNFPLSSWISQYGKNKWRGSVFCPPENAVREKVHRAAISVFKDQLGIEFNEYAKKLALRDNATIK